MKVKKELPKINTKKTKFEATANSNIKKIKKRRKVKKVKNDSEVAQVVKKEFAESGKDDGSKLPLRQQTWNAYLKVFLTSEKLNANQKQIMEFCTIKSLTPPRRKQKFLNFVRNCYENQKDISDEECNELFDEMLKKYDAYKAGQYTAPENVENLSLEPSPAKPSKNKTKKLNRAANKALKNSSIGENGKSEEKFGKSLPKSKSNKKQPKSTPDSSDHDSDEDVEMDE